ncbi:hypothetical protein THASP1DRAFT_33547 [Thamnocephalis sphaerospora]|uniref:Uncharacterized protein n=1 Tax=Thamnocephalis sphaerospora TaxID=78915 RepID=A0A4V1IVN3_9FUNG|nr:hypothetical protein THASP1DRAFT_33547 [Thamnocephalis sphaerospora]|eukprot:RKP04659.1 hypothetical protein THASP1DRAFT_33547 [Thamnocephalis sphaerospora]
MAFQTAAGDDAARLDWNALWPSFVFYGCLALGGLYFVARLQRPTWFENTITDERKQTLDEERRRAYMRRQEEADRATASRPPASASSSPVTPTVCRLGPRTDPDHLPMSPGSAKPYRPQGPMGPRGVYRPSRVADHRMYRAGG